MHQKQFVLLLNLGYLSTFFFTNIYFGDLISLSF